MKIFIFLFLFLFLIFFILKNPFLSPPILFQVVLPSNIYGNNLLLLFYMYYDNRYYFCITLCYFNNIGISLLYIVTGCVAKYIINKGCLFHKSNK